MKRALPFFLVLVLLLSGCGGGVKSDSASQDSFYNAKNEMSYDNAGWAEEPKAEASAGGSQSGSALANAKIIYTANVDLETKDFDGASQALDELVESFGGYYESRDLYQGGTYRSLNGSVRIPSRSFSAFLTQAGDLAHMTNCSEYKENISEAYYDTEARLTTQQTKLERLQKLLAQAENMEDIIQLESAISDTELQIEFLTGSLRKYDSLVDYATVSLSLREVYRLSTDKETPLTFGQRLTTALSTGLERGLDDLEDFVIGLARNWMGVLLLAAVVVVVILVLRRKTRRRRAAKAAPIPVEKSAPPVEPKGEDQEK